LVFAARRVCSANFHSAVYMLVSGQSSGCLSVTRQYRVETAECISKQSTPYVSSASESFGASKILDESSSYRVSRRHCTVIDRPVRSVSFYGDNIARCRAHVHVATDESRPLDLDHSHLSHVIIARCCCWTDDLTEKPQHL